MQTENSFWHELVSGGYQSKSYIEVKGDLDALYMRTVTVRDKVCECVCVCVCRTACVCRAVACKQCISYSSHYHMLNSSCLAVYVNSFDM